MSVPAVPQPSGADLQATALQAAIVSATMRGWRLQAAHPGGATLVSGHRPNHVLHLILTLVTCGFWAFVWIFVALTTRERQLTITVDAFGNVAYQ